ncbi:MAG: acetyl-CoA carboxylase, biotin carboxyl carrier protein [Clostridia bacterium]|jgi:acetyl-CoA carboxylase biotin carboxyl carrier protein|nr:acetyl-CoA carboxylase, biotin carboxyl carrier protein [Clostridia bacterium]MDD3232414.1 acetyl-CoA carboxylase, biotin carboxyl carrier protein [Clostridia bacterium]MDD3862341.1 acetyl-CoA carboxylase, biotin carboxyl carrier protein [Clostridia bacterium]MDD4408903.1 acetyl-CoA carboxylase, biotin carboxyl carrier protein [Clostridia bacterium]
MDFKLILEIIKNFNKSAATTLEIEKDNFKLKLSKNESPYIKQHEKSITFATEENAVSVIEEETNAGFEIKSPLVGTYYAANSPTDEPFVKVNQKVEKGQTLCIIEAMKIMNEIVAPASGTIVAIKPNNGSFIGFDQVLMVIVKE